MFLASVLELATPLILAALGCLLTVRAGVVNIGLDGMMLGGAFVGAAVSATVLGPWVGLLAAGAIGAILAMILAVAHLRFGADIILSGIAVNLLAAGGTVLALVALTRDTGTAQNVRSTPLPAVELPFLSGIPVLDALSAASPLTWLLILGVPVFVWMYFNSRWGLWTRAVGDNPSAVIEAGISPQRVQWSALITSGALAGLAGAQLSLFTTSTFVRDMVQGRGFIALAAVYLGLKHPIGTLLAASAFGLFEALATVLQVRTTIPTDPILALPYVVTILALAVSGMRYLVKKGGLRLV
ncbi:ABC transporter permease [Microbacterium sp. SA39]|uniref:ABC transporter permease n=1 Tax=Microbacterium sp. SA39 TaxID=1263625 RepID=UPI0005FA5625|nr:ABC transporter permease [Microbacterium sp. SA39]KJQ53884.1 Branched-chain amino acid transport system / permease component [Microbacterium sp. SA39]